MARLTDCGAVYIYRDVVDFRKSIDGLVAIVELELELSPFMDAVFVFCNRRRDKLKLVYWDRTGFCLWYKRLDEAKFQWPRRCDAAVLQWTDEQFEWLLSGLNVLAMERHKPLHYCSAHL